MHKRREAQSSALSFMDCICCGFGAVLLLFILTAKAQITNSQDESKQSFIAADTLEAVIRETKAKKLALEEEIEALDAGSNAMVTSLAALTAKQERLAKEVEDQTKP